MTSKSSSDDAGRSYARREPRNVVSHCSPENTDDIHLTVPPFSTAEWVPERHPQHAGGEAWMEKAATWWNELKQSLELRGYAELCCRRREQECEQTLTRCGAAYCFG